MATFSVSAIVIQDKHRGMWILLKCQISILVGAKSMKGRLLLSEADILTTDCGVTQ